jgi:lipoprotein NlpD
MRALWLVPLFVLAGCASQAPVPVGDGRAPVRVEPAKSGTAGAAKLYTVKKGDTLFSIALDHGVDYRELAAWNNLENINRIRVGQQLRVNAPGAASAAAAVADPGTAEVRPIAAGGAVEARPLEVRPLDAAPAASSVPPVPQGFPAVTPTSGLANSETLKRAPKGGKLPYSEANLALLKAQGAAPLPVAAAPAVPTVAAPPAEKPAPAEAPATAADGEVDWAWPAGGKLLATFSEGGGQDTATKGIDIAGKLGDPVQAAAAGKVVYVGNGLRGYGNLVIVRHNAAFLSAYAHNSRILVKEGQAVTRGQRIADLGNSDADQPKLHFEVRHQGKPVDPLKYLPAR